MTKLNDSVEDPMQEQHFNQLLQNTMDQDKKNEWIHAFRQNHWQVFQSIGFPSKKLESWKYTDLTFLRNETYEIPHSSLHTPYEDHKRYKIDSTYNLFFVDGIVDTKISDKLPLGAELVSIEHELLKSENKLKEKIDSFYCRSSMASETLMEHLNLAFLNQGYWIKISKNTKLDKPISIHFIASKGRKNVVCYPFVLIEVKSGAEATLIENNMYLESDRNFFNGLCLIDIAQQGKLTHLVEQEQGEQSVCLSNCKVKVNAQSTYEAFVFSSGGRVIRNFHKISILGEGADVVVNGIYMTKNREHIDNQTCIVHEKGNSQSRQLYKGVLDDQSHAVFSGKVIIKKDAQKVISSQLNKNLLLSEKAEINTKPELQVDADDVKANHGAAIGQMDESELFYLQSRGIGVDQAQKMLARGYLQDVVFHSLSPMVKTRINKRLDQIFDHQG